MSTELLVSRVGRRTSTALREDGVTVELRVEHDGEAPGVGRVVKARVTKVLRGIQSAFLDLGHDRDAFLHVADLVLPGESPPAVPVDPEGAEVDGLADGHPVVVPAKAKRLGRSGMSGAPIEDRLKEGRDLVVQVIREGFGGKGPRVTCLVSLPGRYLVYTPLMQGRGISRRIVDPAERQRLRGVLDGLSGAPGGLIVRTAGEGAPAAAFEADAAALAGAWRSIEERSRQAVAPQVLHIDLDLLLRSLRDAPEGSLDRVVVDDEHLHRAALAYLRPLDPVLASKVRRHLGAESLFDAEGVTPDLEKALRPRVWLKSGGTIVIQQTEALVSIDVNTGKYVGSRRPEETVLKTNLEAAEEIGRQLRLRDLGGIIVVDFIDMDRGEDRRKVEDTLAEALRKDRARTKIVGLSELGLLQLTRKRTRPGPADALTRACPTCSGTGRTKSPETVAEEALLEVRRVARAGSISTRVTAHPDVARALRFVVQVAGPVLDPVVRDGLQVSDDPTLGPDRFDVSVIEPSR